MRIALILGIFCGLCFAQAERPRIAVYVTGGKNAGENNALAARIMDALINSGQYRTIERADAFLNLVAREHTTQRSGAVDDSHIVQLGRQAGAQFVCIAEIQPVFGAYQIVARIVNVETVDAVASGLAAGDLKGINDFIRLSNEVVGSMLGTVVATATVSPSSVAPTTPPTPRSSSSPLMSILQKIATDAQAQAVGSAPFTDLRDGKIYHTIRIGNQIWMAENLNFRPRRGNSWCYDNNVTHCGNNGRLYDWNTASKVCPAGWRLPTREDWNVLFQSVRDCSGLPTRQDLDILHQVSSRSVENCEGRVLKAHSRIGNIWDGDNIYGFTALPSGYRWSTGVFEGLGRVGRWWSATEGDAGSAYGYAMLTGFSHVSGGIYLKRDGFSVRCVRE